MILNALEKFQLKAIDLLGLVLVVKTDEQELIFESVLNNRTKKKTIFQVCHRKCLICMQQHFLYIGMYYVKRRDIKSKAYGQYQYEKKRLNLEFTMINVYVTI